VFLVIAEKGYALFSLLYRFSIAPDFWMSVFIPVVPNDLISLPVILSQFISDEFLANGFIR
jgi:hypothetical protein